jgi:uncharacterized protein
VTPDLIRRILQDYQLEWHGLHGPMHWARVMQIGRRLAGTEHARRDVVELFAVFHDSRRCGEGPDVDHGLRGSAYAQELRGTLFDLDAQGMDLLIEACRDHTDGRSMADVTVGVCWDSDRLDLGRAGIEPLASRLCTQSARSEQMLRWAHKRSLDAVEPDLLRTEWGIQDLRARQWLA